ncbi:hypothetical protein CYQ88_09910 [Hydrogenovibrio sp. SC-1]|uniref:RhuM family protein n=1 Tax=Hydrogenovibrio sp. SC-1 TaxID=2065820 RepID=UPI000C7BB338|nr:RhuM family protein [Hydrogenovibrio sp. SC-1]PLA73681.1 hypothetical protein CYQ88_09835 [Hydrogenovibrio sp. SC-1]PLA73696.1 hypothetical protein CYQ88_09910 [Hydrogenovibrio sp. SC-1]
MSHVEIYKTENEIKLNVTLEDDTVWISQAQMVELFGRERSVITKHVNNVFKDGELEEAGNVQFLHIPNSDKPVKFFNLDVIISVGYRVKSRQGVQFIKCAIQLLNQYLVNGYALNQKRLQECNIEFEIG